MTTKSVSQHLSVQIEQEIPYLRRYARALTGSQEKGDAIALRALQMILKDRSTLLAGVPVRVAMFRLFHHAWRDDQQVASPDTGTPLGKAQAHLAQLTINSREALLLSRIETFSAAEVSKIMGCDIDEVAQLIEIAHTDMHSNIAGRVLIIEDEPIIASDLSAIVQSQGHIVSGIARTHIEAVDLGRSNPPNLILADIRLDDNSSGIEAVIELLQTLNDVPVIFITAYPEQLLTGERPEPAFLITKPFDEDHVTSAISQALFFASTETLTKP